MQVVKQWSQTFGAVYSTHDADSQYVLVSDNANNQAVIFQPSGSRSSPLCAAADMSPLRTQQWAKAECPTPCASPYMCLGLLCWMPAADPCICMWRAATGKASTLKYTVPVPGNPGHPLFYPKNAADNETTFSVPDPQQTCTWMLVRYMFRLLVHVAVRRLHHGSAGTLGHPMCFAVTPQEYLVFFPLTRNTNKANIAAGEAVPQMLPCRQDQDVA
jgi:hypothetical protein